jgi:hypothetical protein
MHVRLTNTKTAQNLIELSSCSHEHGSAQYTAMLKDVLSNIDLLRLQHVLHTSGQVDFKMGSDAPGVSESSKRRRLAMSASSNPLK